MESNTEYNVIFIYKCKQCGKTLKGDWNFCPYCKTSVEVLNCYFCSREVRSIWSYCPYCKKELKTDLKNRQSIDKCNEWLRDILKND